MTSVEELEEQGEDTTGAVESTSKLRSKVMGLTGVDILTESGEYKSTYEIISSIAKVWQDIGDVDQAALLELLAGKNRSNTLAALLSNAKDLENAYKSAMNAEGSALAENKKYLDSIQGRIDQFNNSLQTMWSNTLDSDWVKGFVQFGTIIIKIIDEIGVLNTALVTLATISMIKNKMGPIAFLGGISDSIRTIGSKVGIFVTSMTGAATATSAVSAATLEASVANGALSASQAAATATTNGLTLSKTALTAAEAAEILASNGATQADIAEITTKLGLTKTTATLTAAQIQQAVADGVLTASQGKLAMSMLGTAGAATTLWAALWPILLVMLAIAAVVGVVKLFDAMIVTTKELAEELSDLKSELSDIQSELESVNQELETTQSRMAELLAMDSLSFAEQEELENLKEQNAELERRQRLLEMQESRTKKDVAKKAAETVNSQMSDRVDSRWWYLLTALTSPGGIGGSFIGDDTTEEKLSKEIGKSQSLSTQKTQIEEELLNEYLSDKQRNKKEKELEKIKKQLEESDTYIDETLAEMGSYLDGVEYGYGADEQLDQYYNALYAREIAAGTVGAEADGIEHILSRPEHEAVKDEIDDLVKQFDSGKIDEDTFMSKITEQAEKATADLQAMGLESKDVADYFTMQSSEANFATLDGKIAEMEIANQRFKSALTNSADFSGLFDKDGNASEVAIAEYFQGTSEATRAEVARLIQQIKDGKLDTDDALKQFEYFGIESTLDIYIDEVQTNFKDVFIELDEADGLIDTFQELGEAIGSTADALKTFKQAQAEMANSGRVSIETALQLMEYTDDYGSILQVVDGKLQLVDGAEEALIQTRIDAIKTSAEASLSDATNAYNKAVLARKSYESALTEDLSASVVAKSWEKVLAAGAGLWEGIKSLITSESWTDAYNRGYNATLSQITGYETEYTDVGMQALVDAENDAKELMDAASDRVELANTLTPESLEEINDAGEFKDVEEVEDDRFQREMEYWERQIAAEEARAEQIQNEIDYFEKQGKRAGKEFYDELIKREEQREWLLEQQESKAKDRLQELKNAGKEGSDEWWDAQEALADVEGKLDDVRDAILDANDAIAQIRWDNLTEVTDRFADLHDELSDIRDILQADEMFDDEGNWTEAGVGVLGTYVQDLEMYKGEVANINKELVDLQKDYAGNEAHYKKLGIDSEQELYDKRQELVQQQRDYIKSAEDTAEAIADAYEQQVDAVESYTDTLVESYNDYIEVVKEALDAERDLYSFKKNVQKQTKDIASLERRIASLSGSDNAADIAERRKLESQLLESRESLNDTYYDHAKDQQQNALDEEASAYEETQNRYIQSLRDALKEATSELITFNTDGSMEMNGFLTKVTNDVVINAGIVKDQYIATGAEISNTLIDPWTKAEQEIIRWNGSENTLALMNSWTKEGGAFANFNKNATNQLTSPWTKAGTAVTTFQTNIDKAMSSIYSKVQSNVTNLTTQLGKVETAYNDIYTSANRYKELEGSGNTGGGGGSGGNNGGSSGNTGGGGGDSSGEKVTVKTPSEEEQIAQAIKVFGGATGYGMSARKKGENGTIDYNGKEYKVQASGTDLGSSTALYKAAVNILKMPHGQIFGYRGKIYGRLGGVIRELEKRPLQIFGNGYKDFRNDVIGKYGVFAKGTLGTKQDQFALTDESWIGEEITLAAGKNGQLQYLKKGSAVMPASISANLVEWGKMNPADTMLKNVTQPIIANVANTNTNAIQVNFEALVKADTITNDVLPEVEKLVSKQLDNFTKQLNYSLKRFK